MTQTPTSYVIGRVLRDIGLRQRRDSNMRKDFAVKKLYIRGEADHTLVVFYNHKAEQLAAEFKQVIEEATRELGYPFTVKEIIDEHGCATGHYDVSNR